LPPSELSPVRSGGKGHAEPPELVLKKDLVNADTLIGFYGILCVSQTREILCLKNQFAAAVRA